MILKQFLRFVAFLLRLTPNGRIDSSVPPLKVYDAHIASPFIGKLAAERLQIVTCSRPTTSIAMHSFRIRPVDPSFAPTKLLAHDASSVLHIVDRLGCGEADVWADDAYAFSVCLGDNGFWTIFQRSIVNPEVADTEAENIHAFG